MSLNTYFPEQFDELKAYFVSECEVVRRVVVDPEMKSLLLRAFDRMEQAEDFPHAFVVIEEPFKSAEQYIAHLCLAVSQSIEHNAEALEGWGCRFPDMTPPSATGDSARLFQDYLAYAQNFTDRLPDHIGTVVFVLDPASVEDVPGYRQLILAIASQTRTRWLKYLVLDERQQPLLNGIESENPTIGCQTIYLSPEEMERRIQASLANPGTLTPQERRQYKGLLAGMAFSNKDYVRAETLQRSWVDEANAAGEPSEAANAHYNLGNTLIAKGDFAGAVSVLCRACDLCVDHHLDAIAPFVYTNLGIALHRQGNFKQAFDALKVARDMFKAQNQKPGEAYVVDCLALMHQQDGRRDEAIQSWLYALSIYRGITSPTFQDVSKAGSEDIVRKLESLGISSDQIHRLAEVRQAEAERS